MATISQVTVFSAYKPIFNIFNIFTIFDVKNFQNQERHILIRNVCQSMTLLMLILAFIIAILSDGWYCMDQNDKVTAFAFPFGILINASQLAITYISNQIKGDLADEVIARLEKVIIHREYSFYQ